jgi:FG-GAP-like repeat
VRAGRDRFFLQLTKGNIVVYAKHRCVAVLQLTSFLVFALGYPAGASTVTFQPVVTYPVGTAPKAVAVGDFNGDGKSDLAVANNGDANTGDDGDLSILFGNGNGDGTFQSANSVPGGKNPFAIATADFNRDSKADLVLIDSSGVGVLLGNGDGTFRPVTYLATVSGPLSLVVADFNADDELDLVVVSQSSLSVLLGNGDGTFQAHVDYPAGGPNVAVADINSDGRLDLITERPQGRAGLTTVLLGNGDGTFQNAIVTNGIAFVQQLVVSDFNLDGKPDVALGFVGPNAGTLIMAGNGDGSFQQSSATRLPLFGTTSAADFNGDGKPDLVIIISSEGVASLFEGNGDGTFQSPLSFAVGGGPPNFAPLWAAAAADFNQDNAPDLVVTNSPDNNISVLLNTTGADFSISAAAPTPGTVSRGHSSTSTLSLAHLNSFDNPVALTCSVQPAQSAPTCSFTPSSVTFDANGNATATLTINTGAATASLVPLGHNSVSSLFLWPVAVFGMVGAGFGSRCFTRRKPMFYVFAVLFGGLIVQGGCGGSGGPASTTYTITITGTSSSTSHSTTVPLIVN